MKCKQPIRMLAAIIVLVLMSATPTAFGMLQSILPFQQPDIDRFYARVITDYGMPTVEMQVYYEKPATAEDLPVYKYRYITDGGEPVTPMTVALDAVPNPSPELFFSNYEIRVTGQDEVAGRPCFTMQMIALATGNPVLQMCVDVETGVRLSSTAFHKDGRATLQTTYLEFEPNPHTVPPHLHRDDVTFTRYYPVTEEEFQRRLPWLRLPTWLPDTYEIIGIQETKMDSMSSGPGGPLTIVISDGLQIISVGTNWWEDEKATPPGPFSKPDYDDGETARMMFGMATLRAGPGHSIFAFGTEDVDDLYRILWSMVD